MAINTLVVEDSKDMQAALLDLFSALGGVNVVATAVTETEATELIFKHEGDWQLATLDLLLAEGFWLQSDPPVQGVSQRWQGGRPE